MRIEVYVGMAREVGMAQSNTTRVAGGWLAVLMGVLIVSMAWRTPLAAQKAQLTEKDVLPLVTRCFQCHGESLQMSGLDLRTRAGMLKGGASGPAIVPGHAEESLIFKRVSGQVKPQMPMAPIPALTAGEMATLKEWIDQGAIWTSENESVSAVKPASPAYLNGYYT